MDVNKVYHAHDFSVNMCNQCVPKNALYGKTNNFYWYCADYDIKSAYITVYVAEKSTQKFKACLTKTDGFLVEKIIIPSMKHFNIEVGERCQNVLRLNKISKPNMALPKPNLGRGRQRKIARIYI